MSGQAVFEKMVAYHMATGKVLQGKQFVREIVGKYEIDHVIGGLLTFNKYLDEQRLEKQEGMAHAKNY
ncbi:hypothetical protein [Heyndrickxia camelliae]|uniref:Uncharacterized protein n=1 Tax=Heyndrickxia camelliae TaxID=1707093 RepID=A0A2N3LJZ7_9BACI|nr:hypothetical protein [Heyndrickxia camelliae]PKR84884.1 hypothetical protein CWO92_10950 [Heyndrickxia camelliae]